MARGIPLHPIEEESEGKKKIIVLVGEHDKAFIKQVNQKGEEYYKEISLSNESLLIAAKEAAANDCAFILKVRAMNELEEAAEKIAASFEPISKKLIDTEEFETTLNTLHKENLCTIEIYNRNGAKVYSSEENSSEPMEIINSISLPEWDMERYQNYVFDNAKIMEDLSMKGDVEGVQSIAALNDAAIAQVNQTDLVACQKLRDIINSPTPTLNGRKSHSKDIYTFYCKDDMKKNGAWTVKTDQRIASKMLSDGYKAQDIHGILHHSPNSINFVIAAEKTRMINRIIEEAKKNQEKIDNQQVVKKGLVLKIGHRGE